MLKLVSTEPDAASPSDEPSEFRYWAFLSYSHHDKTVAKRLQKQLETYRVPRRLVGRETSHGVVPVRMSPVFRDRDELHAGADLKASVQEALSRSRWLIVVCTPDAARSPWVNREIIEFKKLHGERRVLALIAHGEPFASDKPGREAEECFPPALRRALTAEGEAEGEALEPIAADMRKEGDGPHRAMLKLAAGMLGVPFDDLVRRDVQRRVRLLTALSVASLAGVVVFAFLAVFAVQARNEAQYQRQQAEGLIEFMLGDLRKRLEPVGRLEVLDAVGEKALGYYGEQDAEKLDATALGHRSRAMHLIGEIRDLRGNLAEAQAAFEQAASTTARLLAFSPKDQQRMFVHAQSLFWVGYAAWKRADGIRAEAKFREYLELSERLSLTDPTNLDWRSEVAFGYVNVGMVQLDTGRAAEALVSLEQAGRLLSTLITQRPDLANELAQNYGWRANALERLGDYDRALDAQEKKLALFRSAGDFAKNKTAQFGVVRSLNPISQYRLALGQVEDAHETANAALEAAVKLVAEDPKNLLWRGGECFARLRLIEIQVIDGTLTQARQGAQEAAECIAHVDATGSFGFRDSMILNARLLWLKAEFAEASQRQSLVSELQSFLAEASPKLAADTPDRVTLAVELANDWLALGDLLVVLNSSNAAQAWKSAVDLLHPFGSVRDGAVLVTLARAHLRLGNFSEAERLSAVIRATSYRHPVYAGFVKQMRAVRGGHKN